MRIIYRIQTTTFDHAMDTKKLITYRGGAFCVNDMQTHEAVNTMMLAAGLRVPSYIHPRAKFWFTELGYNVVGKEIVRFLSLKGENVRVLKKKNPKRSDVAWGDAYQLAVLPIK
jgi:dTDP-4-amino-4,6-dideoxygalactose transaminase